MIKTVDYLPTIESDVVGVDIETNWSDKTKDGANPYVDRIVSIAVSEPNGNVWVMQNNFSAAIPLLINPDQKKIIHGAIYDLQYLNHHLGITTRNIWDSLIVERTINTGISGIDNDLSSTLARRLGVIMDKSVRNQFSNHSGPMTSEQIKYAAEDVVHLIALRESQLKDVSEQQLGKVVSLENAFVSVLVKATLVGIGFDHLLWNVQQKQIYKETRKREQQIAESAGLGHSWDIFGESVLDMNLGSTQQLQKLLKDKFGVSVSSTSEEILNDLICKGDQKLSEFLTLLLEWKEWQHRQTWNYDKFVSSVTGRIHPVWNQLQARTGRMSCKDPNMMNVENPLKGNPDGPNFRLVFPPDSVTSQGDKESEWVYCISDFSKQEPGILAHISGDEKMIEAYNSEDVYVEIAKTVYGKDDISKKERYDVKQGFLSALYGAGVSALANRMSISQETATEFKNKVRRSFPKAARWSDEQEGLLKKRGFTLTLTGRRQNFPQVKNGGGGSYYNASINYPIQGTAADQTKLAGVYLNKQIEEGSYDAAVNILVHDEIVVRVRREHADEVLYQVRGAMEKAAKDLCPFVDIRAEAVISNRWSKE